ncbi:hypothetical protein I6F36_37320 [Bradyrhizobium sp. BRP19]|uniref:YrhB domain-containing protein n=1 Tax=Bradyrhizobium sp. BRP19 TaxID=2793823 RepID=UPI001CD7CD08|nr:YrhB domain-containing protein [Bradyrhizobium sp. BRP19]MCA1552427.1 hypothetical protein [Bradyrhizobium sp. BRP19]
MDFEKAAALATLWVELTCEGQARIVRESTVAKPYGWIFFYEAKQFLDIGDDSAALVGNAPIIVDRDTLELRSRATAWPLEHHLNEYEKTLALASLQRAPQPPTW